MEHREIADTVLNYSLELSPDENLVVDHHRGGKGLAETVIEVAEEIGAEVQSREIDLEEREQSIKEGSMEEFQERADRLLQVYRKADARVFIRAPMYNMEAPEDQMELWREAEKEAVREIMNNTRRLDLEYPTELVASNSSMETEELRQMIYRACTVDYTDIREKGRELKNLLDSSERVRIVNQNSELEFSLGGDEREAVVMDGKENLPDGEVFTAPVRESLNGRIEIDGPVVEGNREIRDPYLEFSEGEVVDYGAESGAEDLESIIETDEGSRYVGEFGIGLNPEIQSFTGRSLIDEKMRETVHLALGRAYPDNFEGDSDQRNESRVHQDFVVEPESVYMDQKKVI